MKLAVDIGGAVIPLISGKLLPRSYRNYLEIKTVHDARDYLTWLVNYLGDNLLLVSGVSYTAKDTQARVMTWLKEHKIFEQTRLKPESVNFLINNEQDETDLCRRLGITHFVTTRALSLPIPASDDMVRLYLLNPSKEEVDAAINRVGDQFKIIPKWKDICDVLGI